MAKLVLPESFNFKTQEQYEENAEAILKEIEETPDYSLEEAIEDFGWKIWHTTPIKVVFDEDEERFYTGEGDTLREALKEAMICAMITGWSP